MSRHASMPAKFPALPVRFAALFAATYMPLLLPRTTMVSCPATAGMSVSCPSKLPAKCFSCKSSPHYKALFVLFCHVFVACFVVAHVLLYQEY